jgi:membrane-bound lytic murein transglycosylase B
MQFLPATWAAYGVDADGDGDPPRIDDPSDAVLSAARYLCANGGGRPADLAGAIWAYNHSPAYVAAVVAAARRYATVTGDTAALGTLRGA